MYCQQGRYLLHISYPFLLRGWFLFGFWKNWLTCLHCLGSRLLCQELSEASPGFYALPRSKLLRFRHLGSPQRCRLGWTCVPFPGLSSSGDQVLGIHTVSGGLCILITSLVSVAWFLGYAGRASSQVCCVSPLGSLSQAVTLLLVVVNSTESQEDVVSSWELAHSLVEDAAAPCLPVLAVVSLPLCLWAGRSRFTVASSPFGDGNGNPLQYSCLENPMDGGAG